MDKVSITVHDGNGKGEDFHATKHRSESEPERMFFKVIFTLVSEENENIEHLKRRVRKELPKHDISAIAGLDSII